MTSLTHYTSSYGLVILLWPLVDVIIYMMYFLTLTAVVCGNLTDPANGQVDHTAGTTFGQTATYSCNTGYNLVENSTRTCQVSGNWSGNAPTCEGVLLHSVYLWSFHEYLRFLLRPFLDHGGSRLLDGRLQNV